MKREIEDIEITSPVGSFESLQAAIQADAGSIYFGVGKLNMRAKSSANFSLDDLKEIASICNSNCIRSYLTLNTVVYDEEIEEIEKILKIVKETNISAIIASDMSVIMRANELNIPVHISTQLNVSNYDAVKYYAKFADVIVLARELTLNQVRNICKRIDEEKICGPSGNKVRIEIFAHGALCMAISGKCYLSLHEHNYSANRGACLQPCRRQYIVKEKETGYQLEIDNEYIMSPKDLCTIGFLDKIIKAGVKILKIEGRGRPAEYVKNVTICYKEAIQAIAEGSYSQEKIDQWFIRLKQVFNRDFWNGYYLGQKLGEWNNSYGSKATKRKVQIGKGVKYYPKINVAVFAIESGELSVNDEILIIGSTTGVIEMKISELRVNEVQVNTAYKGDLASLYIEDKIRPSDKLFKVVDAE